MPRTIALFKPKPSDVSAEGDPDATTPTANMITASAAPVASTPCQSQRKAAARRITNVKNAKKGPALAWLRITSVARNPISVA